MDATKDGQQPDDPMSDEAVEAEERAEYLRDVALLDKHLIQLMEQGGFDSVVVITSKLNGERNATYPRARWRGNWYAAHASAREWVRERERKH
jgi:hypothetical protein